MLELRHDLKIPAGGALLHSCSLWRSRHCVLAHPSHALPGRNPHLQFMACAWEDLRVLPKPLLMYLVAEAVGLCTDMTLWAMGFKLMRCQVRRESCLAAWS